MRGRDLWVSLFVKIAAYSLSILKTKRSLYCMGNAEAAMNQTKKNVNPNRIMKCRTVWAEPSGLPFFFINMIKEYRYPKWKLLLY